MAIGKHNLPKWVTFLLVIAGLRNGFEKDEMIATRSGKRLSNSGEKPSSPFGIESGKGMTNGS